ncbi:MAG TPA: TIGR04325 family methyltransferase [Polyangiaceae bacterium]|nr:TIGR04325 family methyltransferase [Polyangiaceae bacterium]
MMERLFQLPLVKNLYAARFERAFARNWVGAFRGIYRDFAEARASAPDTKPLGYDHDGPAAMYTERFDRIVPADYPVVFWLDYALRNGAREVFDLGGHVGLLFYGFRKYLSYPASFRWNVLDVATVVRAGTELAQLKGVAETLTFTEQFQDAANADLLLASGSLQYIESPSFAESVGSLAKKPQYILINKTPLTEKEPFVTLQNIGTAFCPYLIFNARSFIESIEALGYRLRDRWENADVSCRLPLNPERNIDRYTGLFFERV